MPPYEENGDGDRGSAGWAQYKRMILKELDRLSANIIDLEKRLAVLLGTDVSDLKQKINRLTDLVNDARNNLESMSADVERDLKDAVKQKDFAPYKLMINSFIGMVLSAVVVAFLALIIKTGNLPLK